MFFANHSVFRRCNTSLYGITQLSKKLTVLLVERIKGEMIPMKSSIEKMLIDLRHQMRTMFPTGLRVANSPTDRQKLLVSITQEYVRHLGDSIRGEYRDRIMVRNAELRMYTLVMKKFVDFQSMVSK